MSAISLDEVQIERLVRTKWSSAQQLAEELYAMLGASTNQTVTSATSGGYTPGDLVLSTAAPAGSLPTAFPIFCWAIVTAKLTFDTYKCDIYLKDPATSPAIGNFAVKQRMIDSLETIPNGTEAIAMMFVEVVNKKLVPGTIIMQVPVYLEVP